MDNDSDVEVVDQEIDMAGGNDGNNMVEEGGGDEETSVSNSSPVNEFKRKKASPVWEFAKKVGKDVAVCNICQREIGSPNSNTTNIKMHILGCHAGSEEARILQGSIDERAAQMKKRRKKKQGKKLRWPRLNLRLKHSSSLSLSLKGMLR